jgi:amino acid permease
MITVGTAVGAGMFSLPVVSAGMWFSWSIVCLLVSWFCMYQISLMILEVNLNFKIGDSFDTIVRSALGKGWSIINGLAFAFLLYILDYAYISGGGSIVTHTLVTTTGYAPPQMISGLMFALFFSFIVWLSTRAVARVITILIVSMGLLERAAFLPIIAEGGNVGILLARINEIVAGERLIRFLNIFANMALISSFLGVSLSLFDFISDRFDFTDSPVDRTKCALIAFLPPTFGALIFPDGFLYAIGFAGLVLTLSGLVIVPLMLRKSHKKFAAGEYQVRGGSTLLYVIIALGLLYATFHVLAMLELLPVYGH